MRTFDEYIDEARQNYIFGGTDNRNTDIDSKNTLGELKEGDSVYVFFSVVMKKPMFATVTHIVREGYGAMMVTVNCVDDIFLVNESFKEKTTRFYRRYNVTGGKMCISTNEQDFLSALKKEEFNFKASDIEDCTLDEARQSYIFGGTDDRNTDLEDEPKKLSELKKRDIVYYFNTWTMKRPDIATITDISSGKTNTCIALRFKSNGNIRIATVHNKSLDEDCFFRYLQDPGGDFEVISTNKDSFLSELKGRYRRTIDNSLIDKVDESRQNYIFGGTDDRNTHVTSGTFEDLRVGDSIYCFFSRQMKKPVLATIIGVKEESDHILFDLNCIDDRVIIDKFYKDSTIYYYTRHNIVGGYVLVGTDEKDFLGHLRELRRNFTSRDIEDKTMNESRQNYIFGGTDNRNTNVDKSFDELKKGDFLYVFDSEETKPYTTKVFSTYLDNGMLIINYHVGSYALIADFTQDGAKESFAIRYTDDKYFVAYSTDKNLMIDELEKLKYFFREDDFVYR